MSGEAAARPRLVGLFLAEAEETLATLGSLAGRLSAGGRPEDLADFGRAAHGLKGAAAALGYEELAALLHALEDLSLGLQGVEEAVRLERHGRLARALEILGQGIAHMSASSREEFPRGLLVALRAALGAPGGEAAARDLAPPGGGAGGPAGEGVVERLSVPAGEVDAALRLASSLARGAAALRGRLPAAADASLQAAAQAVAEGAERLEASISSLRLVAAESALSGVEEEAERLAARLGKRAALRVIGREVRADRRTLQTARGMIRHLVRNALDHGIEPPGERLACGKQPEGSLLVRIEAPGSTLRVAVEDDGAGFDLPAVREALARRGADPGRIAALSDAEVLRLLAAEGGSTRESASDVSGRGLGLSAVASLARDAGGQIEVASERGRGSSVAFSLPLEVYAVDVLTVLAGGRLLGLPVRALERTVFLRAAEGSLRPGPSGSTLAVGEAAIPFASLAALLGGAAAPARFAVVVRAEEGAAALGVDDVGSVASVVPAPVPGVAGPGALVAGLARLGDGRAVPVLEPRRLVSLASSAGRAAGEPPARVAPAAPPPAPLDVLLAEDSLATREVLRVLIERQGFRVRVAADGEEALRRLAERLPDVLVTDVQMPRRDGLSLTRELRRDPRTAGLPVVLLTSQEDDATRAAGAAAGADAYLVKSRFDAGVLLETLARIGVTRRR